jgi:hypothetical protein
MDFVVALILKNFLHQKNKRFIVDLIQQQNHYILVI